jgi:hypothetical protein
MRRRAEWRGITFAAGIVEAVLGTVEVELGT